MKKGRAPRREGWWETRELQAVETACASAHRQGQSATKRLSAPAAKHDDIAQVVFLELCPIAILDLLQRLLR